jgi:hypothetical protein
MAKAAQSSVKLEKPKVSRPGVHAKTKTSSLKSSKNYRKLYKGQGK